MPFICYLWLKVRQRWIRTEHPVIGKCGYVFNFIQRGLPDYMRPQMQIAAFFILFAARCDLYLSPQFKRRVPTDALLSEWSFGTEPFNSELRTEYHSRIGKWEQHAVNQSILETESIRIVSFAFQFVRQIQFGQFFCQVTGLQNRLPRVFISKLRSGKVCQRIDTAFRLKPNQVLSLF